MKLNVLTKEGKETGRTVTLDDQILMEEPNDHAIYLDIKRYLAAQRQGTHKSKQRAEIARTTKKLKKQKGTGGARAGSMKSPLFRGGGRVFGPVPRDYDIKVNKKTKQVARKSAISHKAKANSIYVIEDFSMETHKTKEFVKVFAALNPDQSKSLFVFPESNNNVVLSSRNIEKANVMRADDLNTYALMNCEKLFISEGSIEKIKTILN
jgi:large subunit ribosomal protein L4